jgi:putative nucleotidyltransferase with HDIG domain
MFNSMKKQPRLGQWDGRRRSSRSEEPFLPQMWRRPVLLRLATVLVTTVLVTLLVYHWGPPLPYRVGMIYPWDLRVRADFQLVNQAQTERAREEAGSALADPVQREIARRAVPPTVENYPRGMLLLEAGRPVPERLLNVLREEYQAYRRSLKRSDHVRRGIGLFLVFALLAGLVVLYVVRFQTGLAQSLPTIAGICALVTFTLALGMLLSRPPWHAALVPLTVTAMILTIAYNPQFALMMSLSLALAITVALGADLWALLVMMGGLATAIMLLRNVRTRTGLVRVAAGAGLAYLAMTIATGLLSGQTGKLILFDAGRNFLWGSLAGFLLTGSLPLVERCFGIVTDITLLELADGSHPLLQELVRRAPGTYTHSMTLATLAEAAAEAIGANPLLTRVGSYFHDIGKMLKPQYFIENQTGDNRHDVLEPALSTLIIIGHVKDGLALARQYHLPRPVIDFIQQHHGTTLVEYFYREALRSLEASGHCEGDIAARAPLIEPSFRYPGPKPQNRENGIVMLADAVESSSRALGDPTPSSLRKLVHDLLMKRLLDGQFEASGLTLTELHLIETSLSKSLLALFHARIKYPEARPRAQAS